MAQAKSVIKKQTTIADTVTEIVRNKPLTLPSGIKTSVHICKLRDIPVFLQLVADLFSDLGITLGDSKVIENQVAEKLNDGAFILKLISKNWDDTFKTMECMTTMDSEDVQNLDMDDALELVKEIITLNYDFFMQRVRPLLPGLVAEKLKLGQ